MHSLYDADKHHSEDQYFTHRDGRVFPVSVVAQRLERTAYVGAVVVFQDITERRRIHDELKTSEQRLSVALSASSTGLWDYNPVTDPAVYSATWFRMLGYAHQRDRARRELLRSLLHPDDLSAYRRHHGPACARGNGRGRNRIPHAPRRRHLGLDPQHRQDHRIRRPGLRSA